MSGKEARTREVPRGDLEGLKRYWKEDLLSGFLVFLIAMPLCLGIALASGFPASAGIITAVVGGLLCGFISNSELTIKGPAAGLIVIVLGCVTEFGFTSGADPSADLLAYRMTLGVCVVAGVVQILVGLFRAGTLGEFFPTAAVHGLLAAIGVIIFLKQFPVMLGLDGAGEPRELILELPHFITHLNPIVTAVGAGSLAILFLHRFLPGRLKSIPGPLMVLIVAVPAGLLLGINEEGTYEFAGAAFALGPEFLVQVPLQIANAIAFPDFSGVATSTGATYLVLFVVIGSLESLISAKAIDAIDPWRRKTNYDRDLTAVGVGNTVAALLGGLPMISEIVRSRANIDNGGRTRFANAFHGMFLLVLIAAVPGLLNLIPLAALAALLVYVGLRLASPAEFKHMYEQGLGTFVVFLSTIIGVLVTDLLIGIAIGIAVQALVHLIRGVPASALVSLGAKVEREDDANARVSVPKAAVFSTWIPLRKQLLGLAGTERVVVDLTETKLVDKTVRAGLYELERDLEREGTTLVVELPPGS
jgi:MFS superfamily sulfate permease-like transporter